MKFLSLSKQIFTEKRIVSLLLMSCILFLCSCSFGKGIYEVNSPANFLPQPNPHDGVSFITDATLYLRFLKSSYLVPYKTEIKVQANERTEEAALRTLISTRFEGGIYTNSIPEQTQLVNMMDSGDTLFVTLNNAFLDDNNYNTAYDKRMAVCEVLNTLTAISDYSVQILIDKSETGSGERVSYSDLGFDSGYDKNADYASPFRFTNSIVVTAKKELDYALLCLKSGEYSDAAFLFADESSKHSISSYDISKICSDRTIKLYEITDVDVASYTYKCNIVFTKGKTQEEYRFDITLLRYDDVYKIPYDSFVKSTGGKA